MDNILEKNQEKSKFNYIKYISDIFESFSINPTGFQELRNLEETIKKKEITYSSFSFFNSEIDDLQKTEDYDDFKEKKDQILKKFIQIQLDIQEEMIKPWSNQKNKEIIKELIEEQEKIYMKKIVF